MAQQNNNENSQTGSFAPYFIGSLAFFIISFIPLYQYNKFKNYHSYLSEAKQIVNEMDIGKDPNKWEPEETKFLVERLFLVKDPENFNDQELENILNTYRPKKFKNLIMFNQNYGADKAVNDY